MFTPQKKLWLIPFVIFIIGPFYSDCFADATASMPVYNVLDFGAFDISKSDIEDIRTWTPSDNPDKFSHFAINKATLAANKAGGGKVYVPKGIYLIGSLEMKSNVTLYLENGCTLQAAKNGIDAFTHWEHNTGDKIYQTEDFGRVHWKPSVIWAINQKHMTIEGDGVIRCWTDGYGGITNSGMDSGRPDPFDKNIDLDKYVPSRFPQGDADKTIAMKLCSDIKISGITILYGGHFAVILSGCQNGIIQNVMIDSNRDGINLDCCRNMKVTGCTINTMCDDGICIKSPSSLGRKIPSENIIISDCILSGYDFGSVYAKTYTQNMWPNEQTGVGYSKLMGTGRIKLGTESAGGFRNITVTNCVFDNSRGFCIEGVDGGDIENINFSNIVMRKCTNPPIFIRLGSRQRVAEPNVPIAKIKNINISNITVHQTEFSSSLYSSLILGLDSEHRAEGISISNYRVLTAGGGTEEMKDNKLPLNDAQWYPKRDKNGNFIEDVNDRRIKIGTGIHYPEPDRFCSEENPSPAYGFYVRFVRDIVFTNVSMQTEKYDARNSMVFDTVDQILLRDVYETNNLNKKPASTQYINCTNAQGSK